MTDLTPETLAEHDHTGPDWRCEACKPLADVLRARMRWPSLHWGNLHDDAFPSLARAVYESGWYVEMADALAAEKTAREEAERWLANARENVEKYHRAADKAEQDHKAACESRARAVESLLKAEQEVDRLTRVLKSTTLIDALDRATAAEARVAALEAGISALADKYDGAGEAVMSAWVVRDLRVLTEKGADDA